MRSPKKADECFVGDGFSHDVKDGAQRRTLAAAAWRAGGIAAATFFACSFRVFLVLSLAQKSPARALTVLQCARILDILQ